MLRQIADSIERFGFTNPVLIDEDDRILAGHGRVAAARLLELREIPVLYIGDLSHEERKAYALADNKLALNAGWDQELLALELQELIEIDFDVEPPASAWPRSISHWTPPRTPLPKAGTNPKTEFSHSRTR